jgi:hypothetical protein
MFESGLDEAIVRGVVADDPALTPEQAWPLFVAVKVLFGFPNGWEPTWLQWHKQSRLACESIWGNEYHAPRNNGALLYDHTRKRISYEGG